MAVRALLIKPPKRGSHPRSVAVNFEPLGLLHLSAFVKRFSPHHVEVVDAQAEEAAIEELGPRDFRMAMPDEALRRRLRAAAPDVVGISALFEIQEPEVIAVARLVKEVLPAARVVVGGLDAGIRYATYLASGVIDLVVRGEGEETFLDLLDHLDRGASLAEIPGTCVRGASGEARMNAPRVARVPFDEYPFPDRDALPRALYDGRHAQRGAFPFARGRPAVLIQGSRGCRLRCAFCDIVAVHDQLVAHSPEYVVDEIQHCVERYGAREVVFVDDNFMLDQRWARRVFELVAERGLGISFDVSAGVSVWTLSRSMIDTMIRAGVYRVCLPIESGNPATISFIKKPVNLAKAVEMIDYCNRRGLYTFANLIVGFPHETRADIQRTVDWGNASGLDAVHYFIATPLPGSRMYPIYEQQGWIEHGERGAVTWRTEHFTREELEAFAQEASRAQLLRRARFLARPRNLRRYVWPKLASRAHLRYALRLAAQVVASAVATWRGAPSALPSATSRDDRIRAGDAVGVRAA